MATNNKAIVFITEGAAPELLDRWCSEGRLPGFSWLRAEGAHGALDAEGTPYEPPGLLSVLTGQRAADHGAFSYWTCHDPEYLPKVLTNEHRLFPLLWQQDVFADVRFSSIGLFGTHPPEPLNGSLITYPMFATLHACYPKDLQRTLARQGIRPVHDVSIFWTGQARDELLPQLLEADRQRGQTALTLAEDSDIVLVNLTSIDRTSHIYWQELERPDLDAEDSAVFAAYRTCDAIITQALDRVDEHTSVLAFSEIGFGPLRDYCSINELLEGAGFLTTAGGSTVNWDQTQAYEAVQGTHGVNINLQDRYKSGQVPWVDYAAVRADVAQALRSALNPRTGLPFFAAVQDREEVYPGSAVQGAPDLILEPADWRYLPLGDPNWASHVHRTWQSGWHRRRSYWAGLGPSFTAAANTDRVAAPVDISATLCQLMGREVPAEWAGTPLGSP